MSEPRQSPTLLTIPPELRLEIYKLVLLAAEPISPGNFDHTRDGEGINTALLQTCKMIYNEALPILNGNVFVVELQRALYWRGTLRPAVFPQLRAARNLMDDDNHNCLSIDPRFCNFIFNIKIREEFNQPSRHWRPLIEEGARAISMVKRVKSLTVNVDFKDWQETAWGDIEARTELMPEPKKMLIDCFRRLRGVTFANVTGLGVDGGNRALVESLKRSAVESLKRSARDDEPSEDDETEHRPTKQARLS